MNFFDAVKEKINREISPENIILIDNSNLHSKHKSFDANKYHLKIIIKSQFQSIFRLYKLEIVNSVAIINGKI